MGAENRVLTRRQVLKTAGMATLALGLPSPLAAGSAATPADKTGKAVSTPSHDGLHGLLARARSWSYQLQNHDLRQLRASTADILVIDDQVGTDSRGRRTPAPVRQLRTKPDGSRRIVLAYLSIGEAEDYRYYWKPEWIETAEPEEVAADRSGSAHASQAEQGNAAGDVPSPATQAPPARTDRWPSDKAPAWLGDENESWSGNFAVRFEDPDWQAIFLDGPQSYLARIIASGFDGVYLDRVDAFYDHSGDSADPAAQMVAFVARIAETARRLKPGFLIVPQNGEELLLRKGYVDLIDAIAKEDLLYGSPTEGTPNSNGQIINSVGWLSIARRKGHPVLVVEYLDDPATVAEARLELARLGYIATFAPRMLDALSPFAVPAGEAATKPP